MEGRERGEIPSDREKEIESPSFLVLERERERVGQVYEFRVA